MHRRRYVAASDVGGVHGVVRLPFLVGHVNANEDELTSSTNTKKAALMCDGRILLPRRPYSLTTKPIGPTNVATLGW